MYNLDFSKNFNGARLTYAKIDVRDEEKQESFLPESDNANQVQVNNFSHLDINLFEWRGRTDLPFKEFR
jgi:hypothetical protein